MRFSCYANLTTVSANPHHHNLDNTAEAEGGNEGALAMSVAYARCWAKHALSSE